MKKQLNTILIALLSLSAMAETFTYGDLYLKEDGKEYHQEAYMSYTSELNNNFESVSGLTLNYNYYLGRSFQVGGRISILDSDLSDSSKSLKDSNVQLAGPQNAYGIVLTFIPLSGHLNLLSMTSLPFDLSLNTSYGRFSYQNPNGFYQDTGDYYSFGLRQNIQIHKDYFASLEVTHLVRTQSDDFDTSVNTINFGVGLRW